MLGVKATDINSVLMGGHGDDMVPLPRFTTVKDAPLLELLSEREIGKIVDRTRKGGIEIVNLLGCSAYYAPAAGAVNMAEAILTDSKAQISCCAYCDEQYGIGGYFVGVPAILGSAGVEEIVELDLNAAEAEALEKSVEHVKQLCAKVDKLFI